MTVRRPLWNQALLGYSADEARMFADAAFPLPGVIASGLAVTQNSPVAMNVLVAPGYVVVPAKTATKGKYLGKVTANEVVTITAASGSNRIDIVIAQVLDTVDGADGSDVLQCVAVAGTPGSGVPPATPANATLLATVSVLTTDTTIVAARITDQRAAADAAPMCVVRQVSAGTSCTTATGTALLFDTELIDPAAWHSTSSNTSRITPNIAGWYLPTGKIAFNSDSGSTGRRGAQFRKNGATTFEQILIPKSVTAGLYVPTPGTLPVFLNGSTDYVEMLGFQDSGGSLTSTFASDATGTAFGLTRVG